MKWIDKWIDEEIERSFKIKILVLMIFIIVGGILIPLIDYFLKR